MSAFSIPLSGLSASSDELNVIANNLSNLNTEGYKDETLTFGDIINGIQGTSGSGDPIQYGSGVEVDSTVSNFSNGTPDPTGVNSNLALQGNGLFVVQDPNGQLEYTRAGDFTTNATGQLVTPAGQLVLGFPSVNGVVNTNAALAPISVSQSGTIPGSATSTFQLNSNLNADAVAGTTYSEPITVYDSLGNPQTLSVNFTANGGNSWNYSITLPGSATGSAAPSTTLSAGTLSFSSTGDLTSVTPAAAYAGQSGTSGNVTGISIPGLADGASTINLTWNLGAGSATPSVTQLASASTTNSSEQNGYAVGTLTGYSVLSDGTVEGQFSNNQTLSLGQVAVANFANVQGLQQTGDNSYIATASSGAAVVGQAGSGNFGSIVGGAVEESNVNLSTEFANMIVAQQAYEANAKVLTTLDQVSQATIQLVS
jgi:flagellar hook protein FlgE